TPEKHSLSRRDYLLATCSAVAAGSIASKFPTAVFATTGNQDETGKGRLIAYVGTFSSPLRDVLPTQVDLPPGNGVGIHIFEVDRKTGDFSPIGIAELGTSPSCVAIDAKGEWLYSANE